MRLTSWVAALAGFLVAQTAALSFPAGQKLSVKPYKRQALQDLVTWDEYSIFVRGERVMFFSGEFHPFRLPVPGLWLDVFQKIKALGYNGVSFYVDWALLEGQRGVFRADGVFALEPFFDAASQAGIYLLARPGPYINAEVSGGGFPGWVQNVPGLLRVNTTDFLNATNLYAYSIGEIIARAQITNGGPVILFQPENEYSQSANGIVFPNHYYFDYVEDQFRNASIVVPFISNDAYNAGFFAPGTGLGAVDIYGHDGYPLGFDCANPYTWPNGNLPTNYHTFHLRESPTTPFALIEFQGGSFDPWGGPGFANCETLLNNEFERVFYKNDYSFGVRIFNIYMTYGGTNWGNLGQDGGYTSYDYGAVIAEDRGVTREKYSEAKLEATYLRASPAYLTATPGNFTNATYTNNPDITVTPLFGNTTLGPNTNFYVIRHTAYNSLNSTNYVLTLPTSAGNIAVPQLGGTLTLNGRDSKMYVSDYKIGSYNLLYATAEIFTWAAYPSKTVLVVYSGPNEQSEIAISNIRNQASVVEGSGVQMANRNGSLVMSWQTSTQRRVVVVDSNFYIFILDRQSAYNYWLMDLPGSGVNGNYVAGVNSSSTVILKAGYLIRNATVSGNTLALVGDVNATTPVEIIGGAPASSSSYGGYGSSGNSAVLTFNGQTLASTYNNATDTISATVQYNQPCFCLPVLEAATWKYIDSLPEIQPSYDDSAWTTADLSYTNNTPAATLLTPTSLYGSEYGYNAGVLEFRGHFVSTGVETSMYIWAQGGHAFGFSVWLNSTYLGSWAGADYASDHNMTFSLPALTAGQMYVFTVLVDNMGLSENFAAGGVTMKAPRGILDYTLAGRPQNAISWKLTGNLGGTNYVDKTRGPLNEGGLYAERQGYHLPAPPDQNWETRSPAQGISSAGVGFFATSFDLNMPAGYDIPLGVLFNNGTDTAPNSTLAAAYRVELFINGYQFGKYVHNIGPQDLFPVPQGIFNYQGTNYLAMTLWALESNGAALTNVSMVPSLMIQSGYGGVVNSPMPPWTPRPGAY